MACAAADGAAGQRSSLDSLEKIDPYPAYTMRCDAGLAVSTCSVPKHKATDDEAIALLDSHNIVIERGNSLQLLVGDARGDSAVIAWVDGVMTKVRKTGPWQAVTNFNRYGNAASNPREGTDHDRYAKAKCFLEAPANAMTEIKGMELPAATSQEGGTQFSVLFNRSRKELRIAFGRNYEKEYAFGISGDSRRGIAPACAASSSRRSYRNE